MWCNNLLSSRRILSHSFVYHTQDYQDSRHRYHNLPLQCHTDQDYYSNLLALETFLHCISLYCDNYQNNSLSNTATLRILLFFNINYNFWCNFKLTFYWKDKTCHQNHNTANIVNQGGPFFVLHTPHHPTMI